MLPTTKIFLTHHVRQRFHDRGQTCGEPVTDQQLDAMIRESRPVGKQLRKRVKREYQAKTGKPLVQRPWDLFMFHREAKMIFLLIWEGVGRCVAVTCWPVEGVN